ncbi:MAG TPA: type II toxin-antitoxin system VapC family toxin [Chthoniobacterales bacterium]|nr:type II toxin-antitoxin system VapC family toxin [Chthoniobacterales bacterium]
MDSSAWLEYFADGPNAAFFAAPVEKGRELLVPTIVIFEVYKRLQVQRDERTAARGVAMLRQGRVMTLTTELAIAAAAVSTTTRLPMADSIILATARAENAVIWTQDSDFADFERVQFRAHRKA